MRDGSTGREAPDRIRRQTRRTPTPHSRGAALAGLLFVVAGGAVGVFGSREAVEDEAVVVVLFAGIFVLVGLWLAAYTMAYRIRRRRALAPGRPRWERDRRWDRRGVADDGYRRGLRALLAGAFLALFLAPFHVVLLHASREEGPGWALWIPWAGIGLFDLVVLLVLASGLQQLWARRRWGSTRLAFHDFPFRRGGTVDVTFEGGRALRDLAELRAELVCVEEVLNRSGDGSTQTYRALHRDVRTVAPDAGGRARLAFEIPADAPATDFWAAGEEGDHPRYWEIEVTGEAPGVDYRGLFVVPVY